MSWRARPPRPIQEELRKLRRDPLDMQLLHKQKFVGIEKDAAEGVE
jgi:hypothetical protein